MDAKKIDFDARECVSSNAQRDGNSRDEGTELTFVVVGRAETYMP
jgi:hypothetical protein